MLVETQVPPKEQIADDDRVHGLSKRNDVQFNSNSVEAILIVRRAFHLPYWQKVPILFPEHVQTGPVGCSLQIWNVGHTRFAQEVIAKVQLAMVDQAS